MAKGKITSENYQDFIRRAEENIQMAQVDINIEKENYPKRKSIPGREEMLLLRKDALNLSKICAVEADKMASPNQQAKDLKLLSSLLAKYSATDVFFLSSNSEENKHNKDNALEFIYRAKQIRSGMGFTQKGDAWIRGEAVELTNALAGSLESPTRLKTVLNHKKAKALGIALREKGIIIPHPSVTISPDIPSPAGGEVETKSPNPGPRPLDSTPSSASIASDSDVPSPKTPAGGEVEPKSPNPGPRPLDSTPSSASIASDSDASSPKTPAGEEAEPKSPNPGPSRLDSTRASPTSSTRVSYLIETLTLRRTERGEKEGITPASYTTIQSNTRKITNTEKGKNSPGRT